MYYANTLAPFTDDQRLLPLQLHVMQPLQRMQFYVLHVRHFGMHLQRGMLMNFLQQKQHGMHFLQLDEWQYVPLMQQPRPFLLLRASYYVLQNGNGPLRGNVSENVI
jgi:hypothetical protein